MKLFKNVFLSVGMFIFALGMFGLVSSAEAATCTVTTGTWDGVAGAATNAGGTAVFTGCTGGGTKTPAVDDTIQISTNVVLTITSSATVAAVIIDSPVATNGITISGGTFAVTGAITYTANGTANHQTILMSGTSNITAGSIVIPAPTSTGNSVVTNSGSGTFTVGAVTLTGGAAVAGRASIDIGAGTLITSGLVTLNGGGTGIAELTATTGFLDLNAGITFAGTPAQAKIETSGVARVQFTGTLTGAGAINHTTATTTEMVGTVAINAVVAGTGWKSVEIVSGTTTLGAALTTAGLQVDSGATLAAGANLITNTGTGTGVNGFTINGTLSGTGAVTLSGAAVTIDGTGTPSFTGILTLSGATSTIASTAVLTLPAVSIAIGNGVVVTNNGAITATGANGITGGNGTSQWIQGTTGTLNFAGDTTTLLATGILTASAVGNTVNYNKGGVQTVKVPASSYYNLTLGGSGVKTIPATITVDKKLNFITGTSMSLTNGGSSSIYSFSYNGQWKYAGTWGGADSAATNKSATYFAGTVTGVLSVLHNPSDSITTTIYGTPTTTTTTVETTTTTTTTTPTAEVVTVVAPGCSGGNVFNTSTGKPCSNNTTVTSKKTYALGQTTLKNGSKGEAVKELQRFLNDKLSLGLVVDGKLGPKTIAVIKTWQKNNGLVSDGLIGPKTKAMINK